MPDWLIILLVLLAVIVGLIAMVIVARKLSRKRSSYTPRAISYHGVAAAGGGGAKGNVKFSDPVADGRRKASLLTSEVVNKPLPQVSRWKSKPLPATPQTGSSYMTANDQPVVNQRWYHKAGQAIVNILPTEAI